MNIDLGNRAHRDSQKDFENRKFYGNYVMLLPLELSHVDALFRAASQGRDTYRLTSVPNSYESMVKYVESALRDQDSKTAVPFVIVDTKKNRVVGSTRFGNLEYWKWPVADDKTGKNPMQRSSDVPDAAEIGWTWLSEPAQRTGINTEMKLMMLRYAFEIWKVHRVSLKTDSRNERSRRAIERIGARFDGILRADMPAFDGVIRDSAYYSILREEWDQVHKSLHAKVIGI